MFKLNLKSKLISIFLLILIFSATFSSCKKEKTLPVKKASYGVVQERWVGWAIAAVVAIVTEVTQGHYYMIEEHGADGSWSRESGCRDIIGTCSMPSIVGNSGENITIGDGTSIVEKSFDYKVNALLMKSGENIWYAIDKIKYPDLAKKFFYDDKIEITGTLLINNPFVLKKLQTQPITIHGEYDVFQTDNLTYIIIK